MKIKLVKSDVIDNWYTIERAEHDDTAWFVQTGENSFSFHTSERLSPESCIEGDAWEMKTIANAIDHSLSVEHKRVAVEFVGDGFNFWSPKNSKHKTLISVEDAQDLASQIRGIIGCIERFPSKIST